MTAFLKHNKGGTIMTSIIGQPKELHQELNGIKTKKILPRCLTALVLAACFLPASFSAAATTLPAANLKGVTITDSSAKNTAPTAVFTYTNSGDTYTFDASGSTDPDGSIAEYKWDFGDGSTGTGAIINHQYTSTGGFPVTLTAIDNVGGVTLNQTQIVYATIPVQSIDVRVDASADDAEESSYGYISRTSSDLELVEDGSAQHVGVRFNNVEIPVNSKITSAYVEFETDETGTKTTNLSITAENSGNALQFSSSRHDISNRQPVDTAVAWDNLPAWNTVNEKHQTPDISELIQPIVNRIDWSSGNSIVVIISGEGRRTAESYDGEKAAAARLHIEFQ
jgi:PKD repeat protein